MAVARVGVPVLRKDFVVDRYGVWQARALGADAVLLIVRALEDGRLRELIEAAGEAGLDALVEVHDPSDLERALAADATLIGVNARDLATLEVDLEGSLALVGRAAECGATVVAESGIGGPDDVARAAEAGAAAVLVGTSLLREADPAAAAARMVEAAPPARGSPTSNGPARVRGEGVRDADPGRRPGRRGRGRGPHRLRDGATIAAGRDSERAAELSRARGPDAGARVPESVAGRGAAAMATSGASGVQLAGFDDPPAWLAELVRARRR